MFLKWIVCDVPTRRRAAFSEAQLEWQAVHCATGLVAQLGGWFPGAKDDKACILGLWQDARTYNRFFEFLHDAVTDVNLQAETYSAAQTRNFQQLLDMGGSHGLARAARHAGFLRVADCQVAPGHRNAFIAKQMNIWRPAMASQPGMMGGAFAVACDDPLRFLVVSLWSDARKHDRYTEERVPALRKRAAVDDDLEELAGYHMRLVRGWTVLPAARNPHQ